MSHFKTTAFMLVLAMQICASFAFGQNTNDQSSPAREEATIEPPHVHARVALVQAEIELIRLEMGKPLSKWPQLQVAGAAPREVYFQAVTLLRKADRLCFEQTRQRAGLAETPPAQIKPTDVFRVVNVALDRLRIVKDKLGVTEGSTQLPLDPAKTPTDVFRSIVQANRQLNLLLDQQFSPSDVYQRVTFAIAYTARLLARFPGTPRIPGAPPFERGKTPSAVYGRLVGCYQRVRQVAELSGLEMLTLENTNIPADIAPSDVYDIASLIVSEVAYLQSQLKDPKPPQEAFYPGRKFPSHVFQRVGILEAQLESLEHLVEDNPRWLQDE